MLKSRVGAPKRIAVGALATAISLFGVALAPSAGATASVTTSRLAGTTRYGTAQAIATDPALTGGTTAILATGQNFPDALAASGLAGANAPAPIVLTESATYTAEAKAALATLKGRTPSTTRVIIVGGTDAVSATVATAVTADGFTVTRVAGTDRYETAGAIAAAQNAQKATGTVGGNKAAFIATGENFPDALAAGPLAYSANLPILLVQQNAVPAATTKAITDLGIRKVYILGGTEAVSAGVATTLQTQTGNTADRLAGTTRYDTAVSVANFAKATLGFPVTSAILASGLNFPDALAAGPLGGQLRGPILLTDPATLTVATRDYLDANSTTISAIRVVGGTDAVSEAVLTAADAAAETVNNDTVANQTVTTRPELQSASIVSTVAPANATIISPQGTTVAFTFDEPVTGATTTPASFHLVRSSNGTQVNAVSATISSTNNRVVNARFNDITTTDTNATTGLALFSVATVDVGAVTGNAATVLDQNPEGAAPIGAGSAGSTTGGTTSAPDLRTVSRVGLGNDIGNANRRAVDFTFDQAAFTQSTTTGFHLVLTDGTVLDGVATTGYPGLADTTTPGGGAVPGGQGTTTITVLFDPAASGSFSGQAVTLANIARGYVDQGTVGTVAFAGGGGVLNPNESSDTPDAATSRPDLVSATFNPGTTSDSVVYTFDENVLATNAGNAALANANFGIYTNAGTQVVASVNVPVRNETTNTQVAAFFPAGTLANAVGAYVLPAAVVNSSGSAATGQNRFDEVAATATTASTAAGVTNAPDLVSVALVRTNDAFGALASTSAIYTYDQAITQVIVTVANHKLYLASGEQLLCNTAATNATVSTLSTSQVICTAFIFGAGGQQGTNTAGGTPTAAQILSAVLGTVDNNAVTSASGTFPNPEGAKPTTGGTGVASA